jgi:hypothetical protein
MATEINTRKEPTSAENNKESCIPTACETFSRREFMAVSAATSAVVLLTGTTLAATKENNTVKKTFTILHTPASISPALPA